MKPKLEPSPSRHKATKERGLALYQTIKSRAPEPDDVILDPEPSPPHNTDMLKVHKKWSVPQSHYICSHCPNPPHRSNVKVTSRRGNAAYFHLFNTASRVGPAGRPGSPLAESSEDDNSEDNDESVTSGVSDLSLPRLGTTEVAVAAASAAALMDHISSASKTRKARFGAVRSLRGRDRRVSKLNMQKKESSHSSVTTSRYAQAKAKTAGVQLPPLTPEQSCKYFGSNSRIQFYNTYRDLHHIRHDLVGAEEDFEGLVSGELPDLDKQIDDHSESWTWANSYYDELSQSWKTRPDGDASAVLSMTTMDAENSVLGSRHSFDPSSPRAKYLSGCLRRGAPPRASILLRNHESSSLWLDHQGMGDRLGVLFATGLSDIPMITSLNLTDNNLTDISLTAIIEAVAKTPSITDLNLSQNVIGSRAANALAEYLRSKHCTIKKLTLKAANVDDGECHKFVEALGENRVLEVSGYLNSGRWCVLC